MMTVYKNTVLRLNLPVMVLLKSAVNLAHIFKVSAYEELKKKENLRIHGKERGRRGRTCITYTNAIT